ncbi:type II toxin-antitoxin system VapC family toxin [Candidatus Woesearchaeota archaeon]|nr:type II toxin-antitoxin system VapC family toxin [Candidatus Woesearchaeota archaeon]
MAGRYYIDTAIWRDLHENRKDRHKHLGEFAFELFKKIRANKEKIIYSDFIVEELSHAYDRQTIDRLFRSAAEFLEKAETNEKHVKEAAALSKELNIPFGDALHGILAKNNNSIMVTRDRHFKKLSNKIVVKKPEDLL